MKRKKRSLSIKDKDINVNKDYSNSNKHVMNGPTSKISLLQKPITKIEDEGKTVTEVFDTSMSRYEAITEMKESIATSTSIQEVDKNKNKTLSNTQKEGLINPEMVLSITPSNNNNNNNVYTNFPTSTPAIIEEPTSNITKPKQAKGEIELETQAYKKIKNQENHRNENLSNPDSYMNGMDLWQCTALTWINAYNEFVRNAERMNEYWFNLLGRPWIREQKNASSEKIRAE
jgi:hypothetical protein